MNEINQAPYFKFLKKEYIDYLGETVLVTGANGFIGLKLVQLLLEYEFKNLRCLVRSDRNLTELKNCSDRFNAKVEIIQGNLLSIDDCFRAAENATIVYHLAAGVEKSFPGCYLNSAISTRNLLDAVIAKKNKLRRFVNISSLAVYSNEKLSRNSTIDEKCDIDQNTYERWDPYTYGKVKQDEIVKEYAEAFNIPYVIIRPGVVFGPGKAQITGRVGIDTFGFFLHLGNRNLIPFTYVNNCAEAIALAGFKKGIEGHVFNIVDDDLPSSREFLRKYKRNVKNFFSIPISYEIWFNFCRLWEWYSKWSGGQLPPVYNRRRCRIYWSGNKYSNNKAKKMLNWRPKIGMTAALEEYFAYLREAKGK